jgi:hypothetical protein
MNTRASGRTFEAAASDSTDPWSGFVWTKKRADGTTGEPIRHTSRPTLFEHEPAQRITERQREGWLRAFDRHAKAARPNGVRRGHEGTFSHAARQVLAYFLDLASRTGRIFPSYNHIAEVCDLPRSLVHRVLAQLEAAGWIKRERRFRPAPKAGTGEPGPQLEQDSNFYRVQLPMAAARLLAAWQRRRLEDEAAPPPPGEAADRQRRAAVERLGRHRRGLEGSLRRSQEYLSRATDPRARRKLAEAVAELEAQIADALRREAMLAAPRDERESRNGSESSFGENSTK